MGKKTSIFVPNVVSFHQVVPNKE